jgi:adenosylcobinamide-GDP ribazoletransferase
MKWLKSCVAAFRFLTIIPVPTSFGTAVEDLDDAAVFFPVVGLLLGTVAWGGAWFFWRFLPPYVAAVALTILLLSFSGALHLDGLADTADGFFSSRQRERMLEIMRDSRIGVMGVVALWIILTLKVFSLASLQGAEAPKAAFLMVLAGRCALVVMMAVLPYARPEGGLGTRLYSHTTAWTALPGMVIYFLSSFLLYGVAGLVLAGLVMMTLLLFCFFCYRRIGGATGDTLGAACEISELSTVFFAAAWI